MSDVCGHFPCLSTDQFVLATVVRQEHELLFGHSRFGDRHGLLPATSNVILPCPDHLPHRLGRNTALSKSWYRSNVGVSLPRLRRKLQKGQPMPTLRAPFVLSDPSILHRSHILHLLV